MTAVRSPPREPIPQMRPLRAAKAMRALQVYGDSAYGTGAARAAYLAGGHDTVIKPKPLRPAVPRLPQFVGTFRGSAERLCW